MKTTAVIAEYNPFHNGHFYQLNKIKETADSDFIIVIMSGEFTQRGLPAICDKKIRTRIALEHGADLVIELPVIFSTGSAQIFALGAIIILNYLLSTFSGYKSWFIILCSAIFSYLVPGFFLIICLQQNMKNNF